MKIAMLAAAALTLAAGGVAWGQAAPSPETMRAAQAAYDAKPDTPGTGPTRP